MNKTVNWIIEVFMNNSRDIRSAIGPAAILMILIVMLASTASSLTLEEAIDLGLNHTARGSMIEGNLEVAEQNYFARRINFYLPEISIKGSVPSYSVDESYRFFGGSPVKKLFETRDLGFNSFVELNQSLLTGGDVRVTANLLSQKDRYPNTRLDDGSFIDERTRQGYFTFSYTQPLLKPSNARHQLKNTRDDFEIARLSKIEEETTLKKEIIEAYMGVLQLSIKKDMSEAGYEAARLQTEIDSLKLADEILSEEDYLGSVSGSLDAELDKFEVETQLEEKERQLAILLDKDVFADQSLIEPVLQSHIEPNKRAALMNGWELSVPARKAELQYKKARREADYKASGHGLTGDLTANYSTGNGYIKTDDVREDIDTKGWGISLNFSLPLWDGGSSGASVKAANLQAEQARLELERTRQNAKAEIVNLVNALDVSYRRLDIMKKQIDLARNRLNIAQGRYGDGRISRIEYLETQKIYLETKYEYLQELKAYLINRAELDGKYME